MSEQPKKEADKIDLDKLSVDEQQSLLMALEERGAKRADEIEDEECSKTSIVLASGSPLYPSPTEWTFNERQAHYAGLAKVALEPELQSKSDEERIAIAAFKIEIGREVGLPAGASLKRIHFTNNKFEMDSQGLWGVLINYKKHVEKDIQIDVVERSKKRCCIRVLRPSLFGQKWQEIEWLYTTAEAAGLTKTAKANKNPWLVDPDGMLWWRSLGKMCRLVFADLFEGFSYAAEEAATFEENHYPTTLPRSSPKSTIAPQIFDDDENIVIPTTTTKQEETTTKTEIAKPMKPIVLNLTQDETDALTAQNYLDPPKTETPKPAPAPLPAPKETPKPPEPKKFTFDDDEDIAIPTAPAPIDPETQKQIAKIEAQVIPETKSGKTKATKKSKKVEDKVENYIEPNRDADFLKEFEIPANSDLKGTDYYGSLTTNPQDDVPTQFLLVVTADRVTEPMRSHIIGAFNEACKIKDPKTCYAELLIKAYKNIQEPPNDVWDNRMRKMINTLITLTKKSFPGSADSCSLVELTTNLKSVIDTDGRVQWAIQYLEKRGYIQIDLAKMQIKKGQI